MPRRHATTSAAEPHPALSAKSAPAALAAASGTDDGANGRSGRPVHGPLSMIARSKSPAAAGEVS